MANDPFAGLDPRVAMAVKALIQASGGRIGISQGYRSVEESAKIYQDRIDQYGSANIPGKQAAKPGFSGHNHGLAVDLRGDLALAAKLAPQFGLHFPVAGEAWHVEPIWARDANGTPVWVKGNYRPGAGEDLTLAGPDAKTAQEAELEMALKAVLNPMAEQGSAMSEMAATLGEDTTSTLGEEGTATYETPAVAQTEAPASMPGASSPYQVGSAGSLSNPYESAFAEAGQKYGIDPRLLMAIAKAESNFNPNAKSGAGASGLMQFMPGTAKSYGVNTSDPLSSIDGAARMMRDLLNKYGGDTNKALAAYNAGPGAVDKYGGIPPFKETQNYVKKINGYLAG